MRARILLGMVLLAAPLTVAAQQPQFENARVETRPAAAGLERAFQAAVAAQTAPAWLGWTVPLVDTRYRMCCGDSWQCCGACELEARKSSNYHTDSQAGSAKLEGPRRAVVLFRVEQRAVGKIRTFTEDCTLDAGGLPVIWFTDVRPAESVTLLAGFARRAAESKDERRVRDSAVLAIAQHADPSADTALESFLEPSQPPALREKTTFWLGTSRGRRGYEILARLVRQDPDPKLREKAVFALHLNKQPQAVEAIIAVARNDASSRVRGKALFWLAQRAGRQAAAAITEAIERDPETEVKKKAVFALSQLPREEGVPLLIQVARTNKNPAVRKQAMFWLGQSKDPRALAFFEEVLKP